MNDLQLERYSRQILLPNFDYVGQQRLSASTAMIIGLGGLGNSAAAYLAAAGVGKLILIDADCVERSNLQRQILYHDADIGSAKADVAAERLRAQNSEIEIESMVLRFDAELLASRAFDTDIVLDCSDNYTTRILVNQWCHSQHIPLVSGAAIRWEGQLVSFLYHQKLSPCYQCLYSPRDDNGLNCSQSGVISPVVGSMGVLQALDAIKILSGCGVVEHAQLRLFDGFSGQWRVLKLTQDPVCPVCCTG